MLQDLRHGVRLLLQSKSWTLVVILSVALGIGANTALFSVARAVLLESLPSAQPGHRPARQLEGQSRRR